ncbi:PREDICTED: imidazoleglycerol-phosphate dehydratase 2, chloroplastic isoform X1 [Camelina sativa]|uniref:Imidazoleglycerol-phosphate dehydratase n=1 Tax=Camelina sativa TaxID=90675 RepID=A0ABM0V2V6_CAMSA|nr:PREDICTED: imidazoleglycerol-phosphate dehydratase 2, chloroplastic isoform X1 [Camelina sativa]
MLYDVVIGFYSRKNQVGLSHTLVFLVPMELTSSPAQLLRPHLGFRFLLPRRTSIASSSSPSPRFLRMEPYSHRPLPSISSASPPPPGDNGFPAITTSSPIESAGRIGEVKRETKETNVSVKINLDGNGVADSSTGIPFLDHMLDQLASHGLFDVHVRATGDTHIDDHHTNEDVALAIGTALLNALGERKGINRFGDFTAPLDEALIHVSLDLSGRPYLGYNLEIPTQRVGTYDTQLVEHFFQSLVNTSGMTLHIRQLAGRNSHHIIEATFKAFARALRQATESDPRRGGTIPSSKGVLSRS